MATQTVPVFAIQRAAERAFFDFGWLKTYHSFSFGDYFDPNNVNWGELRVFNDDTVLPGKGFGTHPHHDMEIVTYVLRGELEHADSLGHRGVVSAGGVQYISAGSGVRHSEFNHSQFDDVHFVQMWVQPRSLGDPPAYGQQAFSADERRNRWLIVASGRSGVSAPVALRQDAALRVARLEVHALSYVFEPARLGFLFVADGEATVNGERLSTGDAVRIASVPELLAHGTAELVLWDVPHPGVPGERA